MGKHSAGNYRCHAHLFIPKEPGRSWRRRNKRAELVSHLGPKRQSLQRARPVLHASCTRRSITALGVQSIYPVDNLLSVHSGPQVAQPAVDILPCVECAELGMRKCPGHWVVRCAALRLIHRHMRCQGRPVHPHVCVEAGGLKVRGALVDPEHSVVSCEIIEMAPEHALHSVS